MADGNIPSYIIGVTMEGTYGRSLYAVPYYGKEVWNVAVRNDGSYHCYTEIDVSRLTIGKIVLIIVEEVIGFFN